MEVKGVRTTYASPIYKDFVPGFSHPMVERLEANGGLVLAKSNTPEFAAGASTFNEVFGKTRNPWNTSLTASGSTGGGAVTLATGQIWLAHGSDHGGSLRGPGSHNSVVGMRPSPGRVTRGTIDNLFSTSSVEGPMARDVPDLALFLDAITGRDPRDPLTIEPPARPYFETTMEALAKGLNQTPQQLAWADRERAAYYRRVLAYFETYNFLLCPVMAIPAFDVNWRYQDTIDGVKLENYITGSLTTSAISMTACPAMSVPAGFDEYGRPIGLQIVGRPQDETGVLAAGALFEQMTGLAQLLPIDPRSGEVPPI